MSIKREYEIKTHTVTERVCVKETTHCDVCNKPIDTDKGYWHLITGHHDWGNDSIDSVKYFDMCSEDCLRKNFDEYVKESGKNDWNTMYFEVNRES